MILGKALISSIYFLDIQILSFLLRQTVIYKFPLEPVKDNLISYTSQYYLFHLYILFSNLKISDFALRAYQCLRIVPFGLANKEKVYYFYSLRLEVCVGGVIRIQSFCMYILHLYLILVCICRVGFLPYSQIRYVILCYVQ